MLIFIDGMSFVPGHTDLTHTGMHGHSNLNVRSLTDGSEKFLTRTTKYVPINITTKLPRLLESIKSTLKAIFSGGGPPDPSKNPGYATLVSM